MRLQRVHLRMSDVCVGTSVCQVQPSSDGRHDDAWPCLILIVFSPFFSYILRFIVILE